MSEFWRKWESEVINGRFPLRCFLNSSDHSAVFLTADEPHQLADAAIKFIRADPSAKELELAHWRAAAAVSHPRLIRLVEAGECRLGTHELLFIVMEYAEQTLAQVLLHRALTFDEVRQMLRPLAEALAFLHRNDWVHCQVKPTNVCVVNDEVKLASDTIRHTGDSWAGAPVDPSAFDPPEAKGGSFSTAGDIWSLGMTAVAALTQQAPGVRVASFGTLVLPSAVPPAFADILERCLSPDPTRRPSITEIQVQLEEPGSVGLDAPRAADKLPDRAAGDSRARPSPGLIVGGVILLSAAVWGGMRLMRSPDPMAPSRAASVLPVPSAAPPPSAATPARAPAVAPAAPMATAASRGVLHKEIPLVPSSALRTVQGHIRVTVRVTVDPSGKVVDEALMYSGSSRYFAHVAVEASKKWRFDRVANQASRRWLLQFEFTHAGTAADAEPRS